MDTMYPITNIINDNDINIKTKKLISSFHLNTIKAASKITAILIGQMINKLLFPLNININKYVKMPTKTNEVPVSAWLWCLCGRFAAYPQGL